MAGGRLQRAVEEVFACHAAANQSTDRPVA
jgi:hypothetical protein